MTTTNVVQNPRNAAGDRYLGTSTSGDGDANASLDQKGTFPASADAIAQQS